MLLNYLETMVTFAEVPDEISLCINMTGCPNHCEGCHSPHLAQHIGMPLTTHRLNRIIDENPGITTVSFMGGDRSPFEIARLAKWVKTCYTHKNLKVAWYSGGEHIPPTLPLTYFDFIKVGPYIPKFGPLNSRTTNQRFYEVSNDKLHDITYKFWK